MNAIIRTLTTVALGVALLAGSAGTAAAAAPTTDTHGPGTSSDSGSLSTYDTRSPGSPRPQTGTGPSSTGDGTAARPRGATGKNGGTISDADCRDIFTAWSQAVDRLTEAIQSGDAAAEAFWSAKVTLRQKELEANCVLTY